MDSPSIQQSRQIPRELKLKVRRLYHTGHLTLERIKEEVPNISDAQLNEIISEPDDLEDFRLEKFNAMIRKLDRLAIRTIDSIDDVDLDEATLTAKSNLIRNSNEAIRRLYELSMVELDKSDDMALARLLAMGRDEARRQLTDRLRNLFHILFAGQDPEKVSHQLGLLDLTASGGVAGERKTYALDDEMTDAEIVNDEPPSLGLVDGGQSNTAETGGAGNSAQGVGAFRGIKKGKSP